MILKHIWSVIAKNGNKADLRDPEFSKKWSVKALRSSTGRATAVQITCASVYRFSYTKA